MRMGDNDLKKYLLVCFISIFLITATRSVSAEQTNSQQENSAESYQFELVNEENLTELERVFVEYAKVNKGYTSLVLCMSLL